MWGAAGPPRRRHRCRRRHHAMSPSNHLLLPLQLTACHCTALGATALGAKAPGEAFFRELIP